MINPPNNNKFIGLQDQQTLGQLNDPLQAEQDFLAKRMSQPVPVPGDQSPMMQTNYPHARVKQRAIQPLMPMPKERIGKVEEAVVQPMQREVQKPYRTGYERIVRNKRPDAYELKPDIQQPRFEQVPQKTAPFRQDDPGTKYKKGELLDADDFSEISGQSDLAAEKYSDIQEDKKGQYVTSLGEGEYFKKKYDKNFKRPTSSKHIDKWSQKEVERDTIRPRSGKAFISSWKKINK